MTEHPSGCHPHVHHNRHRRPDCSVDTLADFNARRIGHCAAHSISLSEVQMKVAVFRHAPTPQTASLNFVALIYLPITVFIIPVPQSSTPASEAVHESVSTPFSQNPITTAGTIPTDRGGYQVVIVGKPSQSSSSPLQLCLGTLQPNWVCRYSLPERYWRLHLGHRKLSRGSTCSETAIRAGDDVIFVKLTIAIVVNSVACCVFIWIAGFVFNAGINGLAGLTNILPTSSAKTLSALSGRPHGFRQYVHRSRCLPRRSHR